MPWSAPGKRGGMGSSRGWFGAVVGPELLSVSVSDQAPFRALSLNRSRCPGYLTWSQTPRCPLLGSEQTKVGQGWMAAFDPKPTSAHCCNYTGCSSVPRYVRHHARMYLSIAEKFHLREDTIESRTAQAMAMRVIVAARRVTSRRPAIDDPPFAFAR